MADRSRVRVTVTGRVQGVWFRESTRREAEGAGVSGWVRNQDDGTVEAVFEGEPEAVESLVVWAQRGPEYAQVMTLERVDETPEGLEGFVIR